MSSPPPERPAAHRTSDPGRFAPRRLVGIALMALSYVVGWPAVALTGVLAVRLREPLLVAVGGPLLLVVAHLLFALGGYLAGGDRLIAYLRRRSPD